MRVRLDKLHYPALTFIVCLIIALGLRVFVFNEDDISDAKPRYTVEKELEPYLESFVSLASLKGIDLSYIYNKPITIKWMGKAMASRGTNVATAFGRDRDYVTIFVNRDRFNARTEEGKKYVMFHEFGHDILDFPHLENPDRGMMEPTAYTGFFRSYKRFSKEIQEKYLYKSLNKMFDRYLGDDIKEGVKVWFLPVGNGNTYYKMYVQGAEGYREIEVFFFDEDGVYIGRENAYLTFGVGDTYVDSDIARKIKSYKYTLE